MKTPMIAHRAGTVAVIAVKVGRGGRRRPDFWSASPDAGRAMNGIAFLDLFQGIATLFAQEPKIAIGRVVLMLLGFLLVYLGKKEVLEPLLMIPMGLGMSAVNAGVLFLEGGKIGTLFVDPLVSATDAVMNYPADQLAAADLHADVQQRPDRLPGLHGHRRPARRRLRHGASVPEHDPGAVRRTRHGARLSHRRR